MENKKVFIGNLNFEMTEDEVKNLLSKYGTVVSVKMHRKKGYAFAEMSEVSEAAKVVQKLDGVMHKDREIRASLAMKAGKAKSISIKKYKERGQSFSKDRPAGVSGKSSKNDSHRETYKPDGRRASSSTGDKPRTSYGSKVKPSVYNDKTDDDKRNTRSGIPSPERDRWTTEKTPDSGTNEWTGEYSKRLSREVERENRKRNEKSVSGYRSDERTSSGSGRRPLKDFTKEKASAVRPEKREWTHEKPVYKEKASRDIERSSVGKPQRKEWSADKPSGTTRKINDSWRERPVKNDLNEDKSREYSKTKSISASQNRVSRSSKPKSGEPARRNSSNPSRTKSGYNDSDRDRGRQKRD